MNRHMAFKPRWIVGGVYPGINLVSLWTTLRAKDLNKPVPYRLTLKLLPYRNALQVLGLGSMKMLDHVPQLFEARDASASSSSPTLQNDCPNASGHRGCASERIVPTHAKPRACVPMNASRALD